MSAITLVKKMKSSGKLCAKCVEVAHRLERDGFMQAIDRIVLADERDPQSEGMVLARRYGVSRAPFFIVEAPRQCPRIYTVYLAFVREVLQQRTSARDELTELIEQNPDLDLI